MLMSFCINDHIFGGIVRLKFVWMMTRGMRNRAVAAGRMRGAVRSSGASIKRNGRTLSILFAVCGPEGP